MPRAGMAINAEFHLNEANSPSSAPFPHWDHIAALRSNPIRGINPLAAPVFMEGSLGGFAATLYI